MKLRKLITLLLCMALLFSCVLPLASCKKKQNDEEEEDNYGGSVIGGGNNGGNTGDGTETEYTVQVITHGGMPLEGIMVYIHDGEGYSVCTDPKETDENGYASFTLKTSNAYSVQIDGAPKGYNVREGMTKDDRYPLEANGTVIRLSSAPIKNGSVPNSYKLGDVIHDFTLTDVYGESYTLSELLKTKDMVMLNFWYRDCSNCAAEFPYINTVYQSFKDDIEILAINDFPDDTVDIMKQYPAFLGEDLQMPLVRVDGEYNTNSKLTLSRFPSEGYPTSVIIDRYGVITMIEVGAVIGENKWINLFNYFVGDDYKQTLIDDPEMLTPKIEPTVQWTDTSASEIAGALNSGDITVNYYPETESPDSKFSWPFIADVLNGEAVVRPSNETIDTSFATLHAEVTLKPGQAVTFEYLAQTQNNATGADIFYVLVDGKDICSILGVSDEFATCCAYVDPRPVTESNKDVERTYKVTFIYVKDDGYSEGNDTVYLKNLKVIAAEDIPTVSYIFRYAATDLNATKDGYETYVNVYLASDGYYHVGDPAKDTNNPLLLANHLSYTQFDSQKTVSERVYGNEDYKLMVNGVNMFNNWLIYGNAAANSLMSYYTPVTEELKIMLEAYCETYRREVGKAAHENLWLQLCVYYDAYGKDEQGNPAPQLKNPIEGLTDFAAFELESVPANDKNIVATGTVTYTKVLMPRGYLFKFVPEKSGVYRVTSRSRSGVVGWIFGGNSQEWAANGGDRTVVTHSDIGERYCPELLVDTNNDGILELDSTNISMAAYMEAGTAYYIDIAFHDTAELGSFSFDVSWVGENFGHFVQASPGPIEFEENYDGSIGTLVANGIKYTFVEENGVEYAYEVRGYRADGTPILGEKIYADFHYPTTLFQTQSIQALIIANAFNFMITETDREALIELDNAKLDGKAALIAKWVADGVVADADAGEAKWNDESLNDVVKDMYDGEPKAGASYTAEQLEYAQFVIDAAIDSLRAEWGVNFDYNWSYYKMEDIMNGIYHNTDNRTQKDMNALRYLEIYNTQGKAALKELWDAEFSTVTPSLDESVSDVSEWRFNYFWAYYEMEDVKNGIFHANLVDYTDTILKYVELMDNDPEHYERQGCVAVTRELAEILDALVGKYVFEDVKDGWLKFCYYYELLGVPAE